MAKLSEDEERAASDKMRATITAALRKGEHIDAYMHGELNDMLPESEQV